MSGEIYYCLSIGSVYKIFGVLSKNPFIFRWYSPSSIDHKMFHTDLDWMKKELYDLKGKKYV